MRSVQPFPTGPYGGLPPPIPMSGQSLFPYGYGGGIAANTFTLVAATIYYVPYPIFRTQAYAGFDFKDSGAGNNGQKVRVAIYAESSSGGPGALLKDFGETTLSGAGASHKVANSVTISGPQMCYVAMVGDSGSVMVGMDVCGESTGVGFMPGGPIPSLLGAFSSVGFSSGSVFIIAQKVASSYGAFPSTATAPTASIASTLDGSSIPAMRLYV